MENILKQNKQHKKSTLDKVFSFISTKTNEFFWYCSGAEVHIIKICPTDHAKYFGIGGTIFFTALMACFAGGYAFNTAFHSTWMALFFGIFWGSLIFNLDRYIVVTLGKGDGTPKITWDELKAGAPRIIIAILLGFIIAMPLELKLFEKEIEVQVEKLKQKEQASMLSADTTLMMDLTNIKEEISRLEQSDRTAVTNEISTLEDQQIKSLENEIQELDNQIQSNQANLQKYQNLFAPVKDDPAKTAIASNYYNLINNYKGIISNLNNQRAQKHNRIEELQSVNLENKKGSREKNKHRIEELESRRNQIQAIIDGRSVQYANTAQKFDGLMARLYAYESLAEENVILRIAQILITLLFILIEIAPVLFKMMQWKGPYDDIYDRIVYQAEVHQKKLISDINDEINTSIEINVEKNKNKLEAEIRANKELLEKIAIAQAEIAAIAVEKWKQNEIAKIEKNPDLYIKTNFSSKENETDV